MIDILIICGLLVHFFADFVFQRDIDAKLKSSKVSNLINHTATYSLIWVFFMIIGLNTFLQNNGIYNPLGIVVVSILFGIITFIAHTITDFFTSRLVKRFFDKQDYHSGFVVIGFDQILHYLQLYYTFKLLL